MPDDGSSLNSFRLLSDAFSYPTSEHFEDNQRGPIQKAAQRQMIQFLKATDECTVLNGKKKTKKTTGRATNKEQVFQDFLVHMFAS